MSETNPRSQTVLGSLCGFVSTVTSGSVPDVIKPLFFGANLTALAKKDSGVRPIAVGNTLRRLSAAHASRLFVASQHTSNTVLFKVDFKNAFNSLHREAMLNEIAKTHPGLLNFTAAAYGSKSHLFFNSKTISSEGPPLFSDTINPVIQKLKSRFNI